MKIYLTFQTPRAKPPKLRAMKSNLGARRSTLLSLYGSNTAKKKMMTDKHVKRIYKASIKGAKRAAHIKYQVKSTVHSETGDESQRNQQIKINSKSIIRQDKPKA